MNCCGTNVIPCELAKCCVKSNSKRQPEKMGTYFTHVFFPLNQNVHRLCVMNNSLVSASYPDLCLISTDCSHPTVKHLSTDCFLQYVGIFFLAALFQGLQALQKRVERNEQFTGPGLCSYRSWSWTGFQPVHHPYSILNPVTIKKHLFLMVQIHEVFWT